jgi:hypothetical protein
MGQVVSLSAIRARRLERAEQAFIDAIEQVLDEQPVMALEEAVRRAKARIRDRSGER